MNRLAKISAYNLLILVFYSGIIWVWILNVNAEGYGQLGPLVFLMFLIGTHTLANALLAIIFFIKKDKQKALPFLLNAFLIPVIGFSTCYGGIMILDKGGIPL